MLKGILSAEKDKEKEFLTEIYVNYYPRIKKRAIEILNDEPLAEEITQETFIKLIKNVKTAMKIEKDKLPAYVYVILKNTAFDYMRRKKRNADFSEVELDEDIPDFICGNPEESFLKNEELKELSNVLNILPEKERIALEAKYILCLDDKDISKLIGIKKNSVRTYLSRARKRAYFLLKGDAKIE
ncbi:MAG: RNA polymerase sigma factor [Oscillospiraceae bacterium]|nr:RNA polymerase sigma factor [Oscillospiraceae bacterium]